MTADERKRLIGEIFEAVYATHGGSTHFTPREDMPAVVPAETDEYANESARFAWGHERKTGVKHAEVVTGRLVRDERGWLRLAG